MDAGKEGSEQAVSTVFRWRRSWWPSFRLCFLLLVVLFLHLAAFYAIDVAYPPSRKELVRHASLYYLPASDPSVKSILARHEDSLRAFADFKGLESDAPDAARLTLSFEDYKPELLEDPPLEAGGIEVKFPSLVPFASLPNPLVVRGREFVVEVPERRVILLPVGGEKESAVVIEVEMSEEEWGRLGGHVMRVEVGVDAGGRVKHCFIRDGVDPLLDGRLRYLILQRKIPSEWLAGGEGDIFWLMLEMVIQ